MLTAGEVQALLNLVTALVVMVPDHTRVLANIRSLEQSARANVEAKPVPEEYLKGLEFVYAKVCEVLEKLPEPRT